MREKLKNPFVQQYLLEILLPIVGFFFFDWTLTIIAVFYLIDQFASELVYFRRILWISKYKAPHRIVTPLITAISTFIILFGMVLVSFLYLWPSVIQQDFSLIISEIKQFTIEEGWFLLPLVIAVYYMKDLFTFYMPRRYTQHNLKKAILGRVILNTGILLLIIVGLSLSPSIIGYEIIAIFVFLVIKVAYDFSIGKWTTTYSLEKNKNI